jgi:hypothetical protein
MRIFVAGPYGNHNSKDLITQNVKNADSIGRVLMSLNHQVYIPHKMSWGWENDSRITRQQCLVLDISFIEHWAQGLYRLPGESPSADVEVAAAQMLKLPIFYSIIDVDQLEV